MTNEPVQFTAPLPKALSQFLESISDEKPYPALIFDGIICWQLRIVLIVNAVQQAFVENDFAMPSDSEVAIIGLALPKAMQYLAPQANADEIFASIWSRTNACF